ncbi:MAG: tetratricopeptide repeat protein [Deltaproteobacteria bacterium]|nr:tetratricopeptide repeat protein [Deltaproteobacteria bacterium]
METTFILPNSGEVLSHVIEAFDLRRWDPEDVLSTRNGTAVRFLKGERVGEDPEHKIWVATANALLASGVVPEVVAEPPPIAQALDVALRKVPQAEMFAAFLSGMAHHWDAMAGALLRLSAPVYSQRLARLSCLHLVVIDLAVRLAAVLWLTRWEGVRPPAIPWALERGMQAWLRDLLAKSCISRDKVAEVADVHEHTVDAWLDEDVRPNDENLQDLANLLAERGLGEAEDLLSGLRRGYGMRALYLKVVKEVGRQRALGLAKRLVGYAVWMLGLPRQSENPVAENDLKMHVALLIGTLGRGQVELGFVDSMLNTVWREERDPVWRTSIKAATRSWFERLREVAAKLPPSAEDELRIALGELPPPEVREQIAYTALASKEELSRDPLFGAAMDAQISHGGMIAALELKLRAGEASNGGDLLRAIDLHREALRHDPCNQEIHFRLGAELWQVGDVDAGLVELEIAVQLDPSWDRAQVEVAIVLLNLDRVAEALRRLQAAKALMPAPSPWLQLHLAFAHERLAMVDDAIAAYEELLTLQAENAEALDRLAHLLFTKGEKRRGAELAKRAAHLGFTDVFVAWNAGYYSGKGPWSRPPRTVPDHLIQLGDNPCLVTLKLGRGTDAG